MDLGLKDKVAIVTGSARGLGAASARRLAEEGAKVIITDINADLHGSAEYRRHLAEVLAVRAVAHARSSG